MIHHPSQVVAIAGASGLVGTALARALQRDGHTVRRLVRREVRDPASEIFWNPSEGKIDAEGLRGVDAVVNLSGENLAGGRWTEAFKARIRSSRIESTRLLAQTLARLDPKPRVLCSASAIGFYGVRGEERLDEESPSGTGFLAELCRDWEEANRAAWEAGIRVCELRIGVVLSPEGGALEKMLPPFRMGAGAVLGSGEQWMSWVGLPDLVAAIEFVLDNDAVHGAVNVTSPEPVTNREFTQTLARVVGKPTFLTMPAFAVRMMAGREMAEEMLLGGAKIYPRKLQEAGFALEHPRLEEALGAVLSE